MSERDPKVYAKGVATGQDDRIYTEGVWIKLKLVNKLREELQRETFKDDQLPEFLCMALERDKLKAIYDKNLFVNKVTDNTYLEQDSYYYDIVAMSLRNVKNFNDPKTGELLKIDPEPYSEQIPSGRVLTGTRVPDQTMKCLPDIYVMELGTYIVGLNTLTDEAEESLGFTYAWRVGADKSQNLTIKSADNASGNSAGSKSTVKRIPKPARKKS